MKELKIIEDDLFEVIKRSVNSKNAFDNMKKLLHQQAAFTREETIKECIEIINQSMEKANIGEDTYVLKLACNASKAEVRDQLEQLFNQPKP